MNILKKILNFFIHRDTKRLKELPGSMIMPTNAKTNRFIERLRNQAKERK